MTKKEIFDKQGFEDEYGFLCVKVHEVIYSFENGKVYRCV